MAPKRFSQDDKKKGSKNIELSLFINEIEARAKEIFLERLEKHIQGDQLTDRVKAEEEIRKALMKYL
jgi:hypothetical protein